MCDSQGWQVSRAAGACGIEVELQNSQTCLNGNSTISSPFVQS
jgi:hypothetical protein